MSKRTIYVERLKPETLEQWTLSLETYCLLLKVADRGFQTVFLEDDVPLRTTIMICEAALKEIETRSRMEELRLFLMQLKQLLESHEGDKSIKIKRW